MQEVPADLFQGDMQTMPRMDPAVAERLAKQEKQAEAARKAMEREEAAAQKKERAQVQRAVAMPDTKAKKAAAKSTRDKEMMAHKIRLYFKKLGHKLSFKEPKVLPKDEEQLRELLTQIECELQSNGGIEQAGQMFVNGCFVTEVVTQQFNPLGLMLSGPAASLTQTVQANKDKWDELITELAIANAEWFMVSCARQRYTFAAGGTHIFFVAHTAYAARCSRRVPKSNGRRRYTPRCGTNGSPGHPLLGSNRARPALGVRS